MSDLVLRPYAPADIPAVTRIYGHYVRDTVITFETEEPDEAEMATRFATIAGRVESSLFALRALGAEDWQAARAAYADFALARLAERR